MTESENQGSSTSAVIAVLKIRDALLLIAKAKLAILVKKNHSPLVSVDGYTRVLSYMISTGIRNMGLYDKVSIDNGANEDSSGAAKNCGKSKLPHIINDRKFLKFLSSHNGREVVYKNGAKGLDTSVSNHPDMKPITQVQSNTTVTKAAELMMDIRTPCLISKGNKGEEKPIIT